jgi:non-ribosomal peptide synthetase component F
MNVPRGSTPGSARQEPSGTGSRIRPRNPFVEFRAEETEQSIPARFAQQVAAYPNRAAVVTRQHRLTYDELNQAANRVAHAILAQRGEGNETCAFLLGSGAATAAGMLGILKARKILVGLDRASPLARSAYILEHSQAGSMVTDDENQSLAWELAASRIPVINIDRFAHEVSSDDVELSIAPEALAAVAYTSGSTGQPKGVIQSHYNFLYAQRVSTNRLHVAKEDRAVTLFSLAFMGGITTNLRYLLNGACLCPFDIRREGMHALAGWLTQERATVLVANPTTFRHFVGTLKGDEDSSTLRLLLIGGEVLYPPRFRAGARVCRVSCAEAAMAPVASSPARWWLAGAGEERRARGGGSRRRGSLVPHRIQGRRVDQWPAMAVVDGLSPPVARPAAVPGMCPSCPDHRERGRPSEHRVQPLEQMAMSGAFTAHGPGV